MFSGEPAMKKKQPKTPAIEVKPQMTETTEAPLATSDTSKPNGADTTKPTSKKAPDSRAFALTAAAFAPGKGLATELHRTLRELGAATPQQAADALLASG